MAADEFDNGFFPQARDSGQDDNICFGFGCGLVSFAQQEHATLGFAAHRSQAIPNGFDTERLQPNPVRGQTIRRALGIPEGAEVNGHVVLFYSKKSGVF